MAHKNYLHRRNLTVTEYTTAYKVGHPIHLKILTFWKKSNTACHAAVQVGSPLAMQYLTMQSIYGSLCCRGWSLRPVTAATDSTLWPGAGGPPVFS